MLFGFMLIVVEANRRYDTPAKGRVSVCRLRHCLRLHTDTTPPQPNHNVTPTHIKPEQYNP